MTRGPIAIFGGTFNPVHHGHLRSALELREQLGLTQVCLVPAAQPPLREAPECSASLRAELVELAVASEPGLVCDRRELHREGPSYTIDTLAEFRQELGNGVSLSLVVGSDTLARMDDWHRWRELLDYAHLVVVGRPGWEVPRVGVVADWLLQHLTTDPGALQHGANGLVLVQHLRQLPISATEIRDMIAAGRSPRYLIPDPVWEHIQRIGAYGASQTLQEQHGIG